MVPVRREIERLLEPADRDLEHARKHLSIEAYEVAAFLAQVPHVSKISPANARR